MPVLAALAPPALLADVALEEETVVAPPPPFESPIAAR
jgi:hypothetical protein